MLCVLLRLSWSDLGRRAAPVERRFLAFGGATYSFVDVVAVEVDLCCVCLLLLVPVVTVLRAAVCAADSDQCRL